jgi:TetR/AcrR family transcriptional regulator
MGKRALRKDRHPPKPGGRGDDARRSPGRPVGATADVTRERIIAGAIEAFAEHGFAGCSIRDIARQARIRSSSLYHYFPSKEALYQAVLATMQDEMRQLVFSVIGGSHDLHAMGREATGKIFDFFLTRPAYVRFALQVRLDGSPMFDRRTNDRWLGFMEGLIKPAELEGKVKPCDPALLITSVDGLVQWHIANDGYLKSIFGKGLDDPEIAGRVREHVIDVVMRTVGLE